MGYSKINRLLNKKGWTGVEVGKALVASMVHDIKHQSEPDYKPLFSQSDFDKMESSLSTERDYLAYGVYRDIYSGLIDAFNRGQGQYQQFYNGYYRYVMHLKDAQTADNMLERAELVPYVMTEEQYNRLKERAETRLKGFTESFSTLFFTMLSAIMEHPEDAPEAIRTAIEATKEEAVTNERILSSYNETYGQGYYQLADGTRSDQLQGEGWQERLKADYLKKHKLYVNGELASWEDTAIHYNTERKLKGFELFFNGIDAVKALYKEHTGEDLPPEDGEPHLTEFKADYPALYKALEAYIKELVPQAKSLKPAQYSKEFISWGELAELGIKKYITLTTADEHDITELIAQEDEDTVENLLKRRRIFLNGITIAKEPRAYQLNESGDFIDNMQDVLMLATINSVDSIAQSESQREDLVAFQENLFKPALRYIYAFNALVKILGAVYDLEEMGEVELKTTRFESQLDALNNMLYMFYAEVYGTQEEKDRKRELIKEIFCPVDYEELKPTAEAIEAVTAELDKLGFSTEARKKLKKFDSLIEKLCERGL